MSVFIPVPHYFDHCNFVISFEVRKCETFNFVQGQVCFVYQKTYFKEIIIMTVKSPEKKESS